MQRKGISWNRLFRGKTKLFSLGKCYQTCPEGRKTCTISALGYWQKKKKIDIIFGIRISASQNNPCVPTLVWERLFIDSVAL